MQDLTGEWWGNYAYPGGLGPITPFIARIAQVGTEITGTMIEPDNVADTGTIKATIAGFNAADSVDFVKTYDGSASEEYENPVDYVGRVSSDGNLITGVWSLLDMDGTFEMFREAKLEQADQRETNVGVEVPNLAGE